MDDDGSASDPHGTPELLRALYGSQIGDGAGDSRYEDVVDRVLASVPELGRLEHAARRARTGLRLLSTREDRLRAVSTGPDCGLNAFLVELLLEDARSCVDDSPQAAGELAELAEAVAARLAEAAPRRSLYRDLVTEARAHRANAVRASGELERAEELLAGVARRLRDACDPLLVAEVASFAGALAIDRCRFEDALDRLDAAERLFLALDAGAGRIAGVRLLRASARELQGRFGAAPAAHRRAAVSF